MEGPSPEPRAPSPQRKAWKARRLPLPGPDFRSGSDCPAEGFVPRHNLLSCECRPGASDSDIQAVRGGHSHPDQNKPNWLQTHGCHGRAVGTKKPEKLNEAMERLWSCHPLVGWQGEGRAWWCVRTLSADTRIQGPSPSSCPPSARSRRPRAAVRGVARRTPGTRPGQAAPWAAGQPRAPAHPRSGNAEQKSVCFGAETPAQAPQGCRRPQTGPCLLLPPSKLPSSEQPVCILWCWCRPVGAQGSRLWGTHLRLFPKKYKATARNQTQREN